MIIEIPIIVKVKIDTSKIQGVHDSLVAIRNASMGNADELNAIIEPFAQKLQFLEDRKLMIQEAKDSEEERVRLLRSGSGSGGQFS